MYCKYCYDHKELTKANPMKNTSKEAAKQDANIHLTDLRASDENDSFLSFAITFDCK
jgi:hypothetical protein